MYKEETKFWHEIKAFNIKNNRKLSFTRLENSAAHGTPDLLGYNDNSTFFTVELKLKKVKKISFSPHQIYTVLISAAFFLFFTTLKELFTKKFNNISQSVAHFGFSLLILSILFNSILSSEIITNIKIGEKYDYNKGEIFFKKTEERKKSNFNSITAFFEIKDKHGKTVELKPEIRIYNQPVIITSEADIKTTLLEDKFLVMNLVKGNEYFNIRYQIKPFMVWIWISVLLLSLGGLMSLFKRKI